MTLSVADKKILIQSKGLRIPWNVEKELAQRFAGVESDYPSFFLEGSTPVGLLNGFYTEASPFELRRHRKGYAIFYDDEPFAEVSFLPRTPFLDRRTSRGIAMRRIVKMVAPGFPIIYLNTGCMYWGEKQCKFCVVGHIDTEKFKNPEDVAETVEAGVKDGGIKTHVALTSGALPKDKAIDLLAATVKAIKERVDIPVSVNLEPPRDLSKLEMLADADSIYLNMEVFDRAARKRFLPGKSEFSPEYYFRAFKACLDIFEENQVCSVLLAGLESDESYLRGVEALAERGVLPVTTPLYPALLSKLANEKPPSAERMRRIYEHSVEIIRAYGLDPFETKAGFMRGGAIFALKEVWKETSK
jgi:hypothetical protein